MALKYNKGYTVEPVKSQVPWDCETVRIRHNFFTCTCIFGTPKMFGNGRNSDYTEFGFHRFYCTS